jgi:hypothetical protein
VASPDGTCSEQVEKGEKNLEDGIRATDTIVLEPAVYRALTEYVAALKTRTTGDEEPA